LEGERHAAPRSRPLSNDTAVEPSISSDLLVDPQNDTTEGSLTTLELDETASHMVMPEVLPAPAMSLSPAADTFFTSLHAFLSQELEGGDEVKSRASAAILHGLGQIEEIVFRDPERAVERYEAAHDVDAEYVPALRAMRRNHAQAGRWEKVLEALEGELRLTPDELARTALLTMAAEIRWYRQEQADEALELLEQAQAMAPRSRRSFELAREIHTARGNSAELFEVLKRLANITSDNCERARLTVQMAELAEGRLDKVQEAEDLYAHSLELDQRNEKAAVALRRLYQAHQRWQKLDALLAEDAGREHEPDEMFADMYRAGRISELHLGDEGRAASLLETAVALQPTNPLPVQALGDIYQRGGRHKELAVVLKRLLKLVRDPVTRAELYYRYGRLLDDWLSDPEQAAEAYREALAEQPIHQGALRSLMVLNERGGRHEELFELLLTHAERIEDEGSRARAYERAARLCEQQRQDADQAASLYDRAWRLAPTPEAFRALDRIYRSEGRWEALVDLYERRLATSADKALVAMLLRSVAFIYESHLSAPERATKALERLRQHMPSDREALMHLARLYQAAERAEELKGVLSEWARATEDEGEALDLWVRIGELEDGPLRDAEGAITTFKRVLELDARQDGCRDRLKGIYERLGRWEDLVAVLKNEVSAISGAPEKAVALLQVGRICEDKLGALDDAEEAYAQARELAPTYTPATLALEELLARTQRYEPLAKLMVDGVEKIGQGALGAAYLCRAAEIYEERLGNTESAEGLYAHALELDGSCTPARHGLERIYQAVGDRTALESHYLREAEGAHNRILRVRAYLRLAMLFDQHADDPEGAARAYESALKVLEDQPDALHGLADICRRTGHWERLAGLLGHIAAISEDRDAAISALKEWAALVEVHLSQKWDPEPIYQRVLDGDPEDPHAIAALETLAYRGSNDDALLDLTARQLPRARESSWKASLCFRAAVLLVAQERLDEAADWLRQGLAVEPRDLPSMRMLRRIAEDTEQWQEASDLLEREAALAVRSEARIQALLRAGNICFDRLGEREKAARLFGRVFDGDPKNGAAFGRLAEILSAGQRWAEVVSLYERRMGAVEPAARAPLQIQLATIHREHIGDTNAAIAVLAQLLDIDPAHVAGLEQMSALCRREKRWREAEDFLAQLAEARGDDLVGRRDALVTRAEILEKHLGEVDTALDVLQGVLAAQPDDRESLSHCVDIYRKRGDWAETVRLLKQLTERGEPSERVEGLVDLAEIHARGLDDEDAAAEALRRATSLCVEHGVGIERVTEFFERRGDFEGLVRVWGEALEKLPPEGSPGAVAVRLARSRLLAGRLLRPAEAETEIRRALQSAPHSLEARLELAGIHLWGDSLGDASKEYMRVLEQDPLSVDAFRGLYRVFDRKGEVDRAAVAAQAVCVVGEATEAEQSIAEQSLLALPAALGPAAETPLTLEGHWQLLTDRDEPRAARELLAAISEYLPQVFSEELAVDERGLIPLDPEDSITERCELLADVVGVESMQVFLGEEQESGVKVLPGVPPRLSLSRRVVGDKGGGFRFVLGRALIKLLSRTFYLDLLSSHSVVGILAAAAELFDRGAAGYLAPGEEVDDLTRRLGRAIPRRARRALEEVAMAYSSEGPVKPETFKRAAQRSAERGGLLLCGDVAAAMSVLKAEEVHRKYQAALLHFAVGPHHYEARRRLGLAI